MVLAPAGSLVDYSRNGERLKRDRQVKRSKSIPNCTILEKKLWYGYEMAYTNVKFIEFDLIIEIRTNISFSCCMVNSVLATNFVR